MLSSNIQSLVRGVVCRMAYNKKIKSLTSFAGTHTCGAASPLFPTCLRPFFKVICQRNTDIIWFKKLKSPHVPLGIPIEDGLAILKKIGSPVFFESEEERQYKISNAAYNVAIYETNGIVSSAWYDDPIGRSWNLGRQKKVNLYLSRYDNIRNWEARLNNGYIQFYINDKLGLSMSYGLHKDVIRFNKQGI